MAHIQFHPAFLALLSPCFSYHLQPLLLQLVALGEHERDELAHILHRERGGRDASLALVHVTLGGEHAAAYEARDEPPRLPGLLVDVRVLHDVCEGVGVEGEEAQIPLTYEL